MEGREEGCRKKRKVGGKEKRVVKGRKGVGKRRRLEERRNGLSRGGKKGGAEGAGEREIYRKDRSWMPLYTLQDFFHNC